MQLMSSRSNILITLVFLIFLKLFILRSRQVPTRQNVQNFIDNISNFTVVSNSRLINYFYVRNSMLRPVQGPETLCYDLYIPREV